MKHSVNAGARAQSPADKSSIKKSSANMPPVNKPPAHETFRAAALLAVVGGFLDAYTYLLRGGVFANAQTGNMVLLGLRFAEQKYVEAFYCIAPIAAFAIGVLVTELLKKQFTKKELCVFEHWILLIEIIILIVVGFLPLSVPDGVVNVTISFVCSLQVNSFRMLKGHPYASTMCTGNLRSGMELLSKFILYREEKAWLSAAHYFGIILLFIGGAFAGTLMTRIWGIRSVWCCAAILMVIFGIMYTINKKTAPAAD